MADQDLPLPTHCPKCGNRMIHEDVERKPEAAGSGGSAVWTHPGSIRTARCPECSLVDGLVE